MNRTQMFLITTALFAVTASVLASTPIARGQDPYFTITADPIGQCVNLGTTASYAITVSSQDGFSGDVQLDARVDPSVANGPTVSGVPSSVSLAAGQNARFDLKATSTQSTPNQVYTVTVDGLSGYTANYVTVYLAFQPLCGAAGGAVEPVNIIGVLAPFAGIALSIVGLTAATSAVLYARRRKTE